MSKVVVLFGSNLGDREAILNKSVLTLSKKIGEIISKSSIYETEPWGFKTNLSFLNQVIVFDTKLDVTDVLKLCLETEKELGRTRNNNSYSSRQIDIDILFYNSLIFNTKELVIPHPRIAERMFVLIPLNEIMPDFQHPVYQKDIKTLLEECKDKKWVKKYYCSSSS